MPLFVHGDRISPGNLHSLDIFFDSFHNLKNESLEFSKQHISSVPSKDLVYVDQREYAVITPIDENVSVVGTEDATTCHIAVIRHSGSKVTCLAHIDNCDVEQDVKQMVDDVHEVSQGEQGMLELHLIGGYLDDGHLSTEISLGLLKTFHSMEDSFDLKTACITNLNNTVKDGENWPIVYGIGFHVKRGELFHATFPDKGPDMYLRGARHFTGTSEHLKVYDSRDGLLRIGPFSYDPFEYAPFLITKSDEFLRKHMSTSPKVEPPHFADRVRKTMQHFVNHPHPLETIFKDNKPKLYQKCQDGSWQLIS